MSIEVMVDVPPDLVAKATESLAKVRKVSSEEVPARQLFAEAVTTWLPLVVATISEAGLIHKATRTRRPRRFDEETWESLGIASNTVDVAQVALLRCVLDLQARFGDQPERFLANLKKAIEKKSKSLRTSIVDGGKKK